MAEYRLYVPGWAEAVVNVEVPDDMEFDADNTLEDYVMEKAEMPSLCHHCAGGYHGGPSLDIGDDWDWAKATVTKVED